MTAKPTRLTSLSLPVVIVNKDLTLTLADLGKTYVPDITIPAAPYNITLPLAKPGFSGKFTFIISSPVSLGNELNISIPVGSPDRMSGPQLTAAVTSVTPPQRFNSEEAIAFAVGAITGDSLELTYTGQAPSFGSRILAIGRVDGILALVSGVANT